MYIDENGAADAELKVTVEDEEYTADVTFDLDQDGTNDSAVVETDDGGHLAFTDTNGDGDADLMSTFDKDGNLLSQARFEENSGEWVAVDPNDSTQQKANSAPEQTIVVDTDEGERKMAVPTTMPMIAGVMPSRTTSRAGTFTSCSRSISRRDC